MVANDGVEMGCAIIQEMGGYKAAKDDEKGWGVPTISPESGKTRRV